MTHSKSLRWGKIASDLPVDDRLDRDHYRVYILLAASVKRGTDVATVGERAMSTALKNLSPSTIGRRIDELIEWGHVDRLGDERGYRGKYRMLSPVFTALPREKPKASQRSTTRSTGSGVRNAARAWATVQDERRKETA